MFGAEKTGNAGREPTPDSIIRRGADQISCDLDGGAAILQVVSGSYFGLDDVGSFVWEVLANPATFSDLASRIVDEFDVERSRCEADLRALLVELEGEKLIEIDHE